MNLNFLILFFSIVGALFSFLIWRSSESRDIYAQQKIIRNEHLSDGEEDQITIPFFSNGSHLHLIISIDYVRCYVPDRSRRYRIKRLIYGSDGSTAIKLTLKWSKIPEEMPGLGALNLERAISRLDDEKEFNGQISPSGFGKQNIVISSTRPNDVDRELNKFFNLVEEAVEEEIGEQKVAKETEENSN
ncbi:hypothetical protein ACFQL1_20535 [Halomicroarcula sp. GCM10025709]|uniref:hypothetical protein n=1 Tax=Haloarcula TaxID=2237 RepID=UPI0024C39B3B|nr:hypothetical protein [Halomicroarcula sp. YJ-61-S]